MFRRGITAMSMRAVEILQHDVIGPVRIQHIFAFLRRKNLPHPTLITVPFDDNRPDSFPSRISLTCFEIDFALLRVKLLVALIAFRVFRTTF